METDIGHDGGCLCGNVRYRAVGQPKIAGVCHCRYCQLRAGSAFGVLVYFEAADISILSGELGRYAFKTESNNAWENEFCTNCATTLLMRLEVFPGWLGIAGDINAADHNPRFFSYEPKTPDDARLIGAAPD
jgi:hypothetical protein